MTPAEILARYDAEMRANPPDEAGVRHERDGGIVRAVGAYNCILFSNLDPADADAVIADQAASFRAIGAEVEWKVYGHDLPADLGDRLAAAGFEPDGQETLMAFDLALRPPDGAVPAGVEIRRATDAAGLEDFILVSGSAFGRDDRRRLEIFRARLDDPTLGLFVAYADGRPVSAGRMELPPERSFASLWGGGTLPAYRGRGLYRGLVAHRAAEALRRGYRFLTIDARDTTSRPILERLGAIALVSVQGWLLRPQ